MKLLADLAFAAFTIGSSLERRDTRLEINPAPTVSAAEQDLLAWAKVAAISIFPNHTGWDISYDQYIDTSIVATFGSPATSAPETKYNFTTFKRLFTGVNQVITSKLKQLNIEFIDTVAYPFPGNIESGNVYLTGLQSGIFPNGSSTSAARDGLFVTIKSVNGVRKITEWRESLNFYTG